MSRNEQNHHRQQTLDSQRLIVSEEVERHEAFLLLERHCDHRSGLIKETAKKEYYKRQYIKSQAELYEMFSKLEKFNVCFSKNITEFENVRLACNNLQKEIFKVTSEKEHYMNQFLQFHDELLRVHSMWQNLKIGLDNKMFEFESTSPSCSTNKYLGSNAERLSSALDELLIQLEASRQNIEQSEYSAMANKKFAKGTFSADLEQSEHMNHKFLDAEDNQYDDSEEQDLNVSCGRIVSDSAVDKIFAVQENVCQKFEENMTVLKSSSSSVEDSFEKVDEKIKVVCKSEEKFYKLIDPKDRFSEETYYNKQELYIIREEEYEVSDTTESEPEQTSALEVELAEERHYNQRSQGFEMLYVKNEVLIKPLLEKQQVYHLEAELSNEREEKDYYKNLNNESQDEVLQLHAVVDMCNLQYEDKSGVPESSSSSRSDDEDDDEDEEEEEEDDDDDDDHDHDDHDDNDENDENAEDSTRGAWKSVAKPGFQVQTMKQLVEKFGNLPDSKEVLSKDSSLQTDLRYTVLLSIKQRNDDLEEELLKEKDEKDYYKKQYDEAQPELLELRAKRDNFLLKSEETAKTADTCMFVEEPEETISNDSTHYISLDTNSQLSGTSFYVTFPECDQEQIYTLDGGPLKGTQDTERSKESQILCQLEAEGNKVLSLHQRVSALETELSEEKDQKYYYSNLSNELRAELLKLRATLENNNQKSKHKTAVPDTSSSAENDGKYYEVENIKAVQRFADDLECGVQCLSELTEIIKKLAEPSEANLEGTFSLETDQNVQISTVLDAEHENQDAEITELLSIKQRNDDLEEELLKERDEKDYYKNLYDEEHPELLELRAMLDNFLLKSEKTAKTADTCMIIEEPKETISNETISSDVEHKENTSYTFLDTENDDPYVPTLQDSRVAVETHAPQPAQLETSAATPEEPRDTHYISLDPNFQNSGTSLDITAPECDQEQIFTLGGGPLKGTQDTEQSKESQSLCQPQTDISMLFSLHQRISKLDTEVSRESEQKDYYHKLYNESQVELLKLRAILDKTAVPDTASSSGNNDNDYVDENIKAALRFANELESEVQNLSELAEKLNKLAEPHKTNLKGIFSLETDQSAHSSTFLDAKQDDHNVPNLQHPSDSMETMVPECVSEDTSFATPKKFEDTKSEEFTMSEEEKFRISLDVEAIESDQEQISTLEVDVIQQKQDMEERNEEEITPLSSEQQSVCDLEVDVLANASSTGSDNAEFLHLPSNVLQLQIDLSEQSDRIPNQVMPTEVIPSTALVICSQDFEDSDLSTADESQIMHLEKKASFEVTTPEFEQIVITPVQSEQNQDTIFTTDRDAAVETIIPEEETSVIEVENHNIIEPLTSYTESDNWAETGVLTDSVLLDMSFSESDEEVLDQFQQRRRKFSHTFSQTLSHSKESTSSSDELRQGDSDQENMQVRQRHTTPRFRSYRAGRTHPDEDEMFFDIEHHIQNVWSTSAYFLKYIVLTLAFSFLGAYVYHEYLCVRPNFDMNYGLFSLLEPFCTFENVLPVPF